MQLASKARNVIRTLDATVGEQGGLQAQGLVPMPPMQSPGLGATPLSLCFVAACAERPDFSACAVEQA
jgi:hypothetical protein